jgi:hypothetical protein
VGDRSRGRFATHADSPRHDGTPYRGYAYDVGVWDLSIMQGPFAVAPCQTLKGYDSHFCTALPHPPTAHAPELSQLCIARRGRATGTPYLSSETTPN